MVIPFFLNIPQIYHKSIPFWLENPGTPDFEIPKGAGIC